MVWEPATESYDSVQSNQTAHEISYEIGRIDGIAVVLERLVPKQCQIKMSLTK